MKEFKQSSTFNAPMEIGKAPLEQIHYTYYGEDLLLLDYYYQTFGFHPSDITITGIKFDSILKGLKDTFKFTELKSSGLLKKNNKIFPTRNLLINIENGILIDLQCEDYEGGSYFMGNLMGEVQSNKKESVPVYNIHIYFDGQGIPKD